MAERTKPVAGTVATIKPGSASSSDSMTPRNLTRQMRAYMRERVDLPSLSPSERTACSQAIDLAKFSQKFMCHYDDPLTQDMSLGAIKWAGSIHLPFECIAVEFDNFLAPAKEPGIGGVIAFARERTEEREIAVSTFVRRRACGSWNYLGEVVLSSDCELAVRAAVNPAEIVRCRFVHTNPTLEHALRNPVQGAESLAAIVRDKLSMGALHVLLLINALSYRNVDTVTLAPRAKLRKRTKDPLPFDSYRVLRIKIGRQAHNSVRINQPSTRRRPRHHDRQGHNATYEHGVVWRRPCKVNEDLESGKVYGDYQVL